MLQNQQHLDGFDSKLKKFANNFNVTTNTQKLVNKEISLQEKILTPFYPHTSAV